MKRTVARAPQLRGAGLAIAIASVAVIAAATLLPEPGTPAGSHFCLLCGPVGGVSSILNVLLFLPLGLGLALYGFSGRHALLATWALSALIEMTQFLVIPGRYSTLGDVITNTLGGALGFALGRYAFALLRPSPRLGFMLTMAWSAIWVTTEAVSAFGFSPSIPRSEYYGQIGPQLGNFEQFQGRVVGASIGDIKLSDAPLERSHDARELLVRGAAVTATIVPRVSAAGIAPIVRVADSSHREIALLAQNGADLIFGVRTGAAPLRLRPPLFALQNVFTTATPGVGGLTMDTIMVSARYSAREVWMNTQSTTNNDRRIPLTASLGWTLLSPFQWFIEGTWVERVVSVIWVACLLVPLGYWGVDAVRFPRARDGATSGMIAAPIALVLLYVGLVTVPRAFGVTASPPRDWLAALVGILAGSALRLAWTAQEKHRV